MHPVPPTVTNAQMPIPAPIVELLPLNFILANAIIIVPRAHTPVALHVLIAHHNASNAHQAPCVLLVMLVSSSIITNVGQIVLLVTGTTVAVVLPVKPIVLNAKIRQLVTDVIQPLSFTIIVASLLVLLEQPHQMESAKTVQVGVEFVHRPPTVVSVMLVC